MNSTCHEHKAEAPTNVSFALIVCSSSRYNKLQKKKNVEDPSGDLIAQAIKRYGYKVVQRRIVPDKPQLIEKLVRKALKSSKVDAVITCGGTGISPQDVTIETVQPLLETELCGFGEVFRILSYEQIGSAAILTRAIAGLVNGKAVFCLPGSSQAVSLALEKLILPEIAHILKHSREMDDHR